MDVSLMLNKLKDKLVVVRGNCDALVDETISEFPFADSYNLSLSGKKIYLTHGHTHKGLLTQTQSLYQKTVLIVI